MLKKIIQLYNQGKMEVLEKLSDSQGGNSDEVFFEDDGKVAAMISRCKKECANVESEIECLIKYNNRDEKSKQQIAQLMGKRRAILARMAYYASNKLNNVENCIQLLEDVPTDFKDYLSALKSYAGGKEAEAYEQFRRIAARNDEFADHYLTNKIFGKLLWEKGRSEQAIECLYKVVQKRPEDLEVHNWLLQLYRQTGDQLGAEVERKIIMLLEEE